MVDQNHEIKPLTTQRKVKVDDVDSMFGSVTEGGQTHSEFNLGV